MSKNNKFKTKIKHQIVYNTTVLNEKLNNFSNFLIKNGQKTKIKNTLGIIGKNINLFIYNNIDYINTQYPNVKTIFEDFIFKKYNTTKLYDMLFFLIKPPFLIKAVSIPKKLKKKTKQKFLLKIVYRNESYRVKNCFKQIHYYSNKFENCSYQTRLYKSIMFSLFE